MTTALKPQTKAFVPKNYYVLDTQGQRQKVLYIDCSIRYDNVPVIHPNYRGKIAADCYYASHMAHLEPMTLEQIEAIPGYTDYHEDNSVDLYCKVFGV